MSEKSREELLLEYEKEYLQRLVNEGKLKADDVQKSEEVRNEMTVEEAEKVQANAAAQVQASSAAKNQSEDELKKKEEFDNEVAKIRKELQLLKEMATLTEELESLKKDLRRPSKRKATKKKAAPKRKATKKKAAPKRR